MDVQVTIFDLKGNHLGIKASTLDLRQPPPGFHWFPKFMLCPGVTTPRFIETGFGLGRPPKHSGRATQQQFMFFLFVLFFSQTFEGRFSLLQRCNQELSQTIRVKENKSWNKRLLKHDWFDIMEAGHISEIYSISGMKRHVHAPWK